MACPCRWHPKTLTATTITRRKRQQKNPIFMKMIAEYLEHALQFEKLAEDTQDPAFKELLLKQALAYRKLAGERAQALKTEPRPQSK